MEKTPESIALSYSYLVNICIAFKGKINDLNKKKFRSIFYNIVPLILIKIYLFF